MTTNAELLEAIHTLTQAITAQNSAIAELVQQSPDPAPRKEKGAAKPKASTRKKATAKPSGRKYTLSNGYAIRYKPGDGYTQAQTGWTLMPQIAFVTPPGGHEQEFTDHYTGRTVIVDDRETNVNGMMPCRKRGCTEPRKGNAQFCAEHKRQKADAHKQWLSAGKPRVGTAEHDAYLNALSEAE